MSISLRAAFPIVYCEELPKTLAFYRDELGFEVDFAFPTDGEPGFVSLKLGQSELALADVKGQETGTHGRPLQPVGGHRFELCLRTEDVDAAITQLREAGVPVLLDPADQPWGERLAYVEDPEGNPVMLYTES